MSNNTTPKIVMFTKSTAATVTNEIIAALEAVAEKFGLEVSIPADTYDGTSVTAKVKLSISGKKIDYNALGLTDFPPFGTEFTVKDKTYKVVEHFPGKAKYQVIAADAEGARKKFSLKTISEILENAKNGVSTDILSDDDIQTSEINPDAEQFPADDSDETTVVAPAKGKKGK